MDYDLHQTEILEEAQNAVNYRKWLAWLVGMRILKITPRDSLVLKIWDKIIIPVVSKFESWISPPFGQSILIVGQKSIQERG